MTETGPACDAFVDASGLAVLVEMSASLAAAGVRLRVVSPSATLRRLSAICRLDQTLGLQPAADTQSHQHRAPTRALMPRAG